MDKTGLAGSSQDITSFEKMELSISGMRGSSGYLAKHVREDVFVEFYVIRYVDGAAERQVEKTVNIPYAEFLKQLNTCKAPRWNGFHGKHPRGVKDGEQFTIEISAEPCTIKANGSANFPKGFSDFRRWLDEKLREN